MSEFRLYVMEDGDECLVFRERPPLPDEAGELVKEHTFHLKSPIKQAHAQEAERLQWVADPLAGTVKDPGLLGAARAVAFLAAWTLPQPLTLEGFGELAPPLADAIHAAIVTRAYPNPVTSPFWRRCWSKPPDGSAATSEAAP